MMMGIFKTWSDFFPTGASSDSLWWGLSGFLILTEMVSHQNAKSKEHSKAVWSWCKCWTFKHFQRFITLALSVPLPVCTNKYKTDFWCKCSKVCPATAASIAACVWPGQSCCFLLQLWGSGVSWGCSTGHPHVGLSLSCPHLGSHQGCESLSVPYYPDFLLVFPPVSFVDDSIYCTNIVRALERLKQYRLSLITTVNVPQTWSTDQRVFICTINTNTGNPHTAVWRSAFPSQRRSLATVGFLPTCSI